MKKQLLLLLIALFAQISWAQKFDYGTGLIGSNPPGFNNAGSFGNYTITGNNITFTGNTNLPQNTASYQFANVTINNGVTVTITGSLLTATKIKCAGSFTINGTGTLTANGVDGANGITTGTAATAGGAGTGGGGGGGNGGARSTCAGTPGQPGNDLSSPFGRGLGGVNGNPNGAGGGGGGYLNVGFPGSTTGPTAGAGGISYGNAALTLNNVGAGTLFESIGQTPAGTRWLIGGSGGGGGGAACSGTGTNRASAGGGGGGGGAIQITAYNITISASGAIRASGGKGGNGVSFGTGRSAGGGGGSGGVINLQYYTTYTNLGTLNITVNGGIGGTGAVAGNNGGAGSLGRVLIEQDVPAPGTLTSRTVLQTVDNVVPSSINNQIVALQVVIDGGTTPAAVMNSITFRTNGSTNAITNVKIYYTGTSPTFQAINQFGPTVTGGSIPTGLGTFTVNGTRSLIVGTHYFWIAYDIPALPPSAVGNVLDAEVTTFNMTQNAAAAANFTPSVTAPLGNRKLDYCSFSSPSGSACPPWIDFVTTGSLTLAKLTIGGTDVYTSANCLDITYTDLTSNSYTVTQGTSHNLVVEKLDAINGSDFRVFVDWNNDLDFNDSGEEVLNAGIPDGVPSTSGTMNVPLAAVVGPRRMRIISAGFSISPDGCSSSGYGSAYDFTINVLTCNPIATIIGTLTACTNTILSSASSTTTVGTISARQWLLNGSDIGGATGVTYNATASGNYSVRITNTFTCFSTSSSAAVTINTPPTITSQPVTPTATCSGSGTQTLSIGATGTGLTYSWRRNGTAVLNGGVISGQGSNSLTLTNALVANAGSYDVVVSGTCTPAVTSSAVTLTVNALPAITSQPVAPTATCTGSGTQTLSVTATGTGLTYSWRRNGTAVSNGGAISGQGSNTLSLTNALVANAGSYDVVVSGTCTPAVTSSAVTVTVNALPAITIQPVTSTATCSGSGTQTLSVTATGTGLTYSWRRNAVAVTNGTVGVTTISGQGSNSLTLTNALVADAGSYDVVVSGTCAPAVTSSAVTVTVNALPAITSQPPTPTATCSGSGTQTITVAATGTGLTYSWRKGGTSVSNGGIFSGQGSNTLTLTNPLATDAGSYDVLISGTCSSVTSNTVVITVNTPPSITTQPVAPLATCSGSDTQTITVSATGTGLTYSWRKGGIALSNGGIFSGQGTNTLTLTNALVADAGSYDVVISGTCTPSITSNAVAVTVNPVAIIGTQTATICNGSVFTVNPTGFIPVGTTYSWSAPAYSSPNVSGGFAQLGQSNVSQTLSNSGTTIETATYTVTPLSGTCIGSNFTVTVTVYPNLVTPTNTYFDFVNVNTVNLIWNATPNTTNYRLEYSTDPLVSSPTVQNNGTNTTLLITGLVYGTIYYYKVRSENAICGTSNWSDITPFTVSAIVWEGSVSSDWNNVNNWAPRIIPTANDSAILFDVANDPKIFQAGVNGICRYLIFRPASKLHIETGKELVVKDHVTSLGTGGIVTGQGRINMNGSAAQIITGNDSFSNLFLNNSNGISLTSGITSITGVLTTNVGTLTTNGNLKLVSNASTTGMISGIGAGTISGNVEVNRYMPGPFGYRYVSSPIQQSANLQIGDFDAPLIGADNLTWNPAPSTPIPSPFPTCWYYDETIQNPYAQFGWISETSGNIVTGRGYSMIAPVNHTASLTGPVNNGAINLPNFITRTPGFAAGLGVNLIGNPYPSPISWNAFRALNGTSNLSAVVKRFVSSGLYYGQYVDWNGTAGTPSSVGDNIALGQAFFVTKLIDGVSNIDYNNSIRVDNSSTTFYETQPEVNNLLRLQLVGGAGADELVVYFDPTATNNYDVNYDAIKFLSETAGIPNIYTNIDTLKVSINVLEVFNQDMVIPMGIVAKTAGNYQVNVVDMSTFAPSATVYLEDRDLGIFTNLRAVNQYNVNLPVGEHNGRFFIHFRPAVEVAVINETCQQTDGTVAIVNPSAEQQWNVSLLDIAGQVLAQSTETNTAFTNLNDGTYTLRITDASGYTVDQPISIEAGQVVEANIAPMSSNFFYTTDLIEASVEQVVTGMTYEWHLNGQLAGTGTEIALNVTEPGVYELMLKMSGATCIFQTSTSFSVTQESTVGIETAESASGFIIYPNPTNELLNIVKSDNEEATIELIDAIGKKVLSRTFVGAALQIDTQQIKSGVYTIVIHQSNINLMYKLVVVH